MCIVMWGVPGWLDTAVDNALRYLARRLHFRINFLMDCIVTDVTYLIQTSE
jgi:hypothetical protein